MGHILPLEMAGNQRWKVEYPSVRFDGKPEYYPHPDGTIVAPYSAGGTSLASMNEDLVQKCADERLCGGCGTPIDANSEGVFFYKDYILDWGYLRSNEPPMHERCAGYAARACPHIRNEKLVAIYATKWETNVQEILEYKFAVEREDMRCVLHEEFLKITRASIS